MTGCWQPSSSPVLCMVWISNQDCITVHWQCWDFLFHLVVLLDFITVEWVVYSGVGENSKYQFISVLILKLKFTPLVIVKILGELRKGFCNLEKLNEATLKLDLHSVLESVQSRYPKTHPCERQGSCLRSLSQLLLSRTSDHSMVSRLLLRTLDCISINSFLLGSVCWVNCLPLFHILKINCF